MELPSDLHQALTHALGSITSARLGRAAAALSQRYRAGKAAEEGSLLSGPDDALAYAAHRMPATYAAIGAALTAANARMSFAPRQLLDVGAGTGAAAWAATALWPELERATLIERDSSMLALGRQLAAQARAAVLRSADWRRGDLAGGALLTPHDLVTAAYLLGELSESARVGLVDRLWAATGGLLVIIEPGTPSGFAVMRAARDRLLAAGAIVVAPCPHQAACPLTAGDWCHFAQRLARPAAQRRVKGAELGYEDEKFAYVALARSPGTSIAARIIRHPHYAPGRVELQLCTPAGIEKRTVPKSAREIYRAARDLRWGDEIT